MKWCPNRKSIFLCSLMALVFPAAFGCEPGLVAYYPFNGNPNDATGHGYNGIVQGAQLAPDRFGKERCAYRFDGVDDSIEVLSAPFSFDGNFALAFWETSAQSQRMHALSLGNSESDNLDVDFNDSFGIWVYWHGGGGNFVRTGESGAFTNADWHHVVLQRTGSDVELYIDAAFQGRTEYTATMGSLNRLVVGRGSFVDYWWDGSVDEVRIYDRFLSQEEIAQLAGDRPFLEVLSPNGGETWASGSNQTIRWRADPSIEQVKIEYTVNNGDSWHLIVENTSATTGTYAWTIPEAGWSIQCKVRVSDAHDAGRFDESNHTFVVSGWKLVNGNCAFTPRDGAGALVFQGKMWLLGGWTPQTNSEVWSSSDGHTWTLETVAPWEPRHTAGYAVYDDRMWIIGGDPLMGHYQNDVWYSPDGVQWHLATDTVPWKDRVLHHVVVHDEKIWLMGGQSLPQYAPAEEAFYNDVWSTTDGINWIRVTEHAPWEPRGMIGGAVVFNGKMWILGGGTYDTPDHPVRDYYNDVWCSEDGSNWMLVTEHAPWQPRQYHDIAVFDNKMWVLEGFHGVNLNDVWYSEDGMHWNEIPDTPWPPRHASSVFVYSDALWMVAGNLWNDVWTLPPQ